MPHNADPQILGNILLLQSSLQVAPNEGNMGEQVCHVITQIQGVQSTALYVQGEIVAHVSADNEEDFDWPLLYEELKAAAPDTFETDSSNLLSLSIQTRKKKYGSLALKLADKNTFQDYLPFIENTLNFVALLLENKKQAEELQYEQDFLNVVLDTIEDGIVACDSNGVLTFFNRATRQFHGLPEEPLPPDEWGEHYDLYLADGKTPMKKEDIPLFKAFSGKKVHDCEMVIAPKGKKKRIMIANGQQLTDANGNIIGAVASMHDITTRKEYEKKLKETHIFLEEEVKNRTRELQESNLALKKEIDERKATERALNESRKKYKEFADFLPQIVFEVDLQGNLLYSNLKGPELTGYSFEDIKKGINAFELVTPEEKEKLLQNMTRIIENGVESSNEYTFVRKDGSTFPVIISSRPIIQNDKVIGFSGVIFDITDRKKSEDDKAKLESQLRQAHKMEAIGTMAGGIAHDFNNILSIIINATEMIQEDTPQDSQIKHYSEMALKAANRAKDLVKQILAFSRQSEQTRVTIQPYIIIKENLKLLSSTIPSTVKINQFVDSQCGCINADPTQFNQLVINLCNNAVQAMNESGVLTIKLKEVTFREKDPREQASPPPGKYAKLTISDTGCGMDQNTVDRIFEPFFTTKDVGKGTGMGLAVVHGIVKSHDGSIEVHSVPGEGTTFDIYFPVIQREHIHEEQDVSEITGGNERILFVDDENMIVDMGKKMIERLGYKVTIKTDPQEAYNTFKSAPDEFDLVITDQTMPHMTGAELALELLKIKPGIPIILCTGFSSKISAETAKELGICEFLFKPLDKYKLSNTIRKVLDN